MTKVKSKNFYEIGYLARGPPLLSVPVNFLQGICLSDMICMSQRYIDHSIEYFKKTSKFRKTEKHISSGRLIEYYQSDKLKVGIIESLPAIQIQSLSLRELEGIINELDLPIAYSVIYNPST